MPYRHQQQMMRQGDDNGHAMVVLSGTVKIKVTSEFGRELLVGVRGRGDLLGEAAALEHGRRTATVTASGPATARVFRGVELAEFMVRHNEACLALAAVLGDRLGRLHARCADMIVCPAPIRVVRVLADLVRFHGRVTPEGWNLGFRLTQHELASLAGVALTSVEKALRDLRADGVLERRHRRLVITDLAGLRRIGGVID